MAQSLFVKVVSNEEKKNKAAFHHVQSHCPKGLMNLGMDAELYYV